MTPEDIVNEINEFANRFLARRPWNFEELVNHVEAVASMKFGQPVHLINPRMEDRTLVADGFRAERSVEQVFVSGALTTPEEGEGNSS